MNLFRLISLLTALLLAVEPAAAAVVQIGVKDNAGTVRNFNVTTNTDLTGNLSWNNTVCDQAAGANCAGVKAASTAPLATDPALVVTLSQNAGLGAAATPMQVSIANTGANATPVLVNQPTGTNLHTVVDSGTVTTVSTVTNLAQMNGAALLMGNGVTGTGSQRVTIASDNTAFAVNATLQASAATAIGKVDPNTPANWNTTWAGGTLGAMANYGTSPGPVLVPGANVFVTNATPGLANNADAIAAVAASSTSPVPVNNYEYIFNGSTFDRVRSVKAGSGIVAVANGGSFYQHIAASQTATVLQSSAGAAGDYLSHCVIYPSTTGAGSVTVFDNTNAAATNVIEFTTGTLSNLAPITIPVGAVSTAGAWKVTTGANETVVCYGKFS